MKNDKEKTPGPGKAEPSKLREKVREEVGAGEWSNDGDPPVNSDGQTVEQHLNRDAAGA